MLTTRKMAWMGAAAVSMLGLVTPKANAFSTVDRAAAIVVFPKVVSDIIGTCVGGANPGEQCGGSGNCEGGVCRRRDTVVQLINQNPTNLVAAHCFYLNANSHCSNTGAICTSSVQCQSGGYQGECLADCSELDFDVRITHDQPLVWVASEGLGGSELPLSGNAGTRVPPVPEQPFLGELRCIQVDPNDGERRPTVCASGACANDLLGRATIQSVDVGTNRSDAMDYLAIGLTAVQNDGNGDLAIGSPSGVTGLANEYEACPMVLVADHLFDGGSIPVDGSAALGELTLVPCGEDLWTQTFKPVTAQFLIYNEFEQRFSTSRQVSCVLNSQLSRIDTTQPTRSIFSAGVAGSLAGQTRVRGVNGGLLGVVAENLQSGDTATTRETVVDGTVSFGAAYNVNQFGERLEEFGGDLYRIP